MRWKNWQKNKRKASLMTSTAPDSRTLSIVPCQVAWLQNSRMPSYSTKRQRKYYIISFLPNGNSNQWYQYIQIVNSSEGVVISLDNSWCITLTVARTTGVVHAHISCWQAHNSCCATEDTDRSQQHILSLPTNLYSVSSNNISISSSNITHSIY